LRSAGGTVIASALAKMRQVLRNCFLVGMTGIALACDSTDAPSTGENTGGSSAGHGAADAGSGGDGDQAMGGGAGQGGDGGLAGAAGEVVLQPWSDDSSHLDVRCNSFFDGTMEFRADRAELSAEQLGLLTGLRGVALSDRCLQDELNCEVSIVDSDRSSASYIASEEDGSCAPSSALAIAFLSLKPFLDTVPCRYGKHDDAPPIGADARCLQGLFTPFGGTTIEQVLELTEPGRSYHVELDECSGAQQVTELSVQLFDDANKVIATGTPVATPGPDGACLALDVSVDTATNARLVVTTTPSFSPVSDFFFQFY